jgi:glutathione peroxidase-family protein
MNTPPANLQFLVSKDGAKVTRYGPRSSPLTLEPFIQELLAEKDA